MNTNPFFGFFGSYVNVFFAAYGNWFMLAYLILVLAYLLTSVKGD